MSRTYEKIQEEVNECGEAVKNLDAQISTLWDNVRRLSDEVAASFDQRIAALKADIDAIKGRLELFKVSNSPFRDNRKLLYQEAGQWARHFSTVRMTVITFTITTCAAIMALNKEWPPDKSVMIPIGILWGIGVLVFWAFTFHTYKQIRRQMKKRPLLSSDFSDDLKPKCLPIDWASLIIPALSIGYIWLLADASPCGTDCWTCGLWWLFVAVGVIFPFVIFVILKGK